MRMAPSGCGKRIVAHLRDRQCDVRRCVRIEKERCGGDGLRRDAETIHVGDARNGIAHAGAERTNAALADLCDAPVRSLDHPRREVATFFDEERDDLLGNHVVVEVDRSHRDVIAGKGG